MARIKSARLCLVLLSFATLAGCKKDAATPAAKPSDPPLVTTVTGMPGSTSESGTFAPLTRPADSAEYGFTPEQAVKTASLASDAVQSEHAFLRSLRGPKGEVIRYKRLGSCCLFKLEGAPFGGGLLDVYEVTYDGLAAPLKLYLNMYQSGNVFIPRGLTARPQ